MGPAQAVVGVVDGPRAVAAEGHLRVVAEGLAVLDLTSLLVAKDGTRRERELVVLCVCMSLVGVILSAHIGVGIRLEVLDLRACAYDCRCAA